MSPEAELKQPSEDPTTDTDTDTDTHTACYKHYLPQQAMMLMFSHKSTISQFIIQLNSVRESALGHQV